MLRIAVDGTDRLSRNVTN